MRYSLLFILFIWTTLSVCAFDSLRTENREGKLYIIHQVDQGETVYSISRRYNVDPAKLISTNDIQDNYISIEQILAIPYDPNPSSETAEPKSGHVVSDGETLFSIARKYGVAIDEIRKWNNLNSNEISLGQVLEILKPDSINKINVTSIVDEPTVQPKEPVGYTYYVQTAEDIWTIAGKFNTRPDSIKLWNQLKSDDLKIGQKLYFPFEVKEDSIVAEISSAPDMKITAYGSKKRSAEQGGIRRVVEEGIARQIESDMKTTKYLALHRKLKVGDILEVRNLMNNNSVYVRVVGTLPNTGINKKVMIRLTESVFESLGILDDKALVEITYFDN